LKGKAKETRRKNKDELDFKRGRKRAEQMKDDLYPVTLEGE
jgi:hypothetical protein